MKPIYFTPAEAAAVLNVSPSFIRWLCDTQRLKCVRTPSGRRLIRAGDLERLAAERLANPPRTAADVQREARAARRASRD